MQTAINTMGLVTVLMIAISWPAQAGQVTLDDLKTPLPKGMCRHTFTREIVKCPPKTHECMPMTPENHVDLIAIDPFMAVSRQSN